jgi:hypothetical protein
MGGTCLFHAIIKRIPLFFFTRGMFTTEKWAYTASWEASASVQKGYFDAH